MRWVEPWEMLPLHALAWMPVRDASNLYRAEYVRWCRERLPAEAWGPLDEDAALLAALYARGLPGSRSLHAFARFHPDRARFVQSLPRAASELRGTDALTPWGARAFAQLDEPLLELFRVALARTRRAWEQGLEGLVTDAGLEGLSGAVERVREVAPGARVPVRVALPLGLAGRAYADEVLVGCVGGWAEARPEDLAQQWLHECAVLAAAEDPASPREEGLRHGWVEACAVRAVDALVGGTSLASDRARWRARHELAGLGDCGEASVRALSARLRGAGR